MKANASFGASGIPVYSTPTVLLQNTPPYGFGFQNGAGAPYAQSFMPSYGCKLVSAAIFIDFNWGGSLRAELWSHTGTFGTSSTPGTLLATGDTVTGSFAGWQWGASDGFQALGTFSGVNQVNLTAGTPYVIIVRILTITSNYVSVRTSSSDSISGNAAVTDSGGNWTAYSSYDLGVKINVLT